MGRVPDAGGAAVGHDGSVPPDESADRRQGGQTMNIDLHYMTITADRRDLDRRAARLWVAVEASRKQRGRPHLARLRWAAGAVLVHVGQYLQGGSTMEIVPKPTA
jgi:hypothetical protein